MGKSLERISAGNFKRLSYGSFIEDVEGEPGHKLPELLLAGTAGFLLSVVALSARTMEGDWICRGRVFPDSFLSWGGGCAGTGRLAGGTVLLSVCFLGTGGGNEEETRPGLAGSFDLLLATLFGELFVKGFPGDLNS